MSAQAHIAQLKQERSVLWHHIFTTCRHSGLEMGKGDLFWHVITYVLCLEDEIETMEYTAIQKEGSVCVDVLPWCVVLFNTWWNAIAMVVMSSWLLSKGYLANSVTFFCVTRYLLAIPLDSVLSTGLLRIPLLLGVSGARIAWRIRVSMCSNERASNRSSARCFAIERNAGEKHAPVEPKTL